MIVFIFDKLKAALGAVFYWLRSAVAWIWAGLGRLLRATKPVQPLGFVVLPMAALGLAGPLLSGLKVLGLVAGAWVAIWGIWKGIEIRDKRIYNSGHSAGYALAVKRVTEEMARDTHAKEEEAAKAEAEVVPLPETELELANLCKSDPDCRGAK